MPVFFFFLSLFVINYYYFTQYSITSEEARAQIHFPKLPRFRFFFQKKQASAPNTRIACSPLKPEEKVLLVNSFIN